MDHQERTRRSLSCECGFSVTANALDDLVEAARHHAQQAHQMTLSTQQLASLAKELDDHAERGTTTDSGRPGD
jgi:predicted small metal-binding protein